MDKNFLVFKRKDVWKTGLIVLAVTLLASIPVIFGEKSEAQNAPTAGLFARLTGEPIGEATPAGSASSVSEGTSFRAFEVRVSNVNLPARTNLSVTVDGNAAGTLVLGGTRSGFLRLTGTQAPTVNAGSAIAVKNGETTILSGTFAAPPSPSPTPTRSPFPSPTMSPRPSPSPSPTMSPRPSPTPRPTPSLFLYAPLSGETIEGVAPRGVSNYAEFGETRKVLGVFVHRVNLPVGTVLTVKKGDTNVGTITLGNHRDGSLRLDTANGGTVPTVAADDVLTVVNGETTVLSGSFRAPGPHPSPSPSPSGSPTPAPTPRPARFFGGKMGGSQVVPPVTTTARGMVAVKLNQEETQIKVSVGYFGLSSNASSAKIYGPAEIGANGEEIFDLGEVTGTSGRIIDKTFDVNAEQVAELRAGMWYVQIASADNANGEIRGQIRSRSHHSSFTGTSTSDLAVYRQGSGTWFISTGVGYMTKILGIPGDTPVSADYDGDGNTDVAVYRGGTWIIKRSSDNGTTTKQFGLPTDTPVRGDFDGDGENDLTVFRSSTGVWYSWLSSTGSYKIVQFGQQGDTPIASDFDGDGVSDIGVFRNSTGVWYRLESSNGQFKADQFGMQGDVPVTGDFDGDGRDDITVFRKATGDWYVYSSSTGGYFGLKFGTNGDVPVASDFDGDGTTDIAVFRASNSFWYIRRSFDGTVDYKQFGVNGDIPASGH